MTQRRDFLKECHTQVISQVKEPLPLTEFGSAYCVRCFQPECSRSTHGVTKFDQRVATWKERLFLEVPRMDSSDPLYKSISSKDFQPVQESLVVLGWGETDKAPEPRLDLTPEPPQEVAVSEVVEGAGTYFQPASTPASISRETLLLNTSVESEQYLPGAPKPSGLPNSTKKRIDSWGASEQSTPSEVVVTAGATVQFGSGSGVSK